MRVGATSLHLSTAPDTLARQARAGSGAKGIPQWVWGLLACLGCLCCGCDALDGYERQIEKASRDIEHASTPSARAAAFARRGRGYSDKARLALQRKRIGPEDYRRLFALALDDHARAIELDPGNTEMYFARGLSYYDRGTLANELAPDPGPWLDAARADFATTVAMNPRHASGYDYLGLVDEQAGRVDQAILDYTSEMALNPTLGRMRLADVYCHRGRSLLEAKQYEGAASDFEQSIALEAPADGCSCEPYNPLAYLYIDVMRDYEKGWGLVRKAHASKGWIAPEYIERLSNGSPGSAAKPQDGS